MSKESREEPEGVEIGEGPPLRREKLPKPPKAGHLLGPGIILAAMGIGMGEMIMWPRMALMWGTGVLWLALLGFTIQYFVQMEMSRWVTATGESFFQATARMGSNGTPKKAAKARAAVAPVLRQGPSPGPWEKAMRSISLASMPAFLRADVRTLPISAAWWRAASLGWMPPSSGMWVLVSLARIVPSEHAMPTPRLSAVDSMPRQMSRLMCPTFKQ